VWTLGIKQVYIDKLPSLGSIPSGIWGRYGAKVVEVHYICYVLKITCRNTRSTLVLFACRHIFWQLNAVDKKAWQTLKK
jgi:hypothetical protein